MGHIKMESMELSDDDKLDMMKSLPEILEPEYPFGLRICLCKAEMDKLDLDPSDCNIGDIIDMRAFGVVTAVAKERVEIQIQQLGVENETTEDGDDD